MPGSISLRYATQRGVRLKKHVLLAFTGGRPWRWPQRLAVYLGYGLGIVVGVANALDLDHPVAVRPPQREFGGIPGPERAIPDVPYNGDRISGGHVHLSWPEPLTLCRKREG